MLNIVIPNNNFSERKYVIDTIFSDFLGLDYKLNINNSNQDYLISFGKSELIIKDYFFNSYPIDLSYLSVDTLPKMISFSRNDFTIEDDIPIIYGYDGIIINNNRITCEIDIFASSFFMLTRWEEYVNKTQDEHKRFPVQESIAYKFNFLHRPVVNEYVEMLWLLLVKIGYRGKRLEKSFNLCLTHDIDHMEWPKILRITLGDIFKRKNLKLAWNHFNHYVICGHNPFDTFDFIMKISESLGVKSHFYFMSSDTKLSPDTNFYLTSRLFRKKIKQIKARGHIIGFHPGYFTFDDKKRWRSEKRLLERKARVKIVEGRQHYLRFETPGTFKIWDENNMEIDSSMGYAEKEGFRCGTGDLFHVFHFLERRQLILKEQPLIIMDGTLRRHYTLDKSISIIKQFMVISKKYHSTLTILFHNSTFYAEGWDGFDNVYVNALTS